MSAESQRIKRQERLCREWNQRHPVGTAVRYWFTIDKDGVARTTTTRSEAKLLCGRAVVWLEGVRGCWSIATVEAIT